MGKGKGEWLVGNWDEDVVIMVVEVCCDCLGEDDDCFYIDVFYFVFIIMLFVDCLNLGIIVFVLMLEVGIQVVDVVNI